MKKLKKGCTLIALENFTDIKQELTEGKEYSLINWHLCSSPVRKVGTYLIVRIKCDQGFEETYSGSMFVLKENK